MPPWSQLLMLREKTSLSECNSQAMEKRRDKNLFFI
jgi:hypothetical protein